MSGVPIVAAARGVCLPLVKPIFVRAVDIHMNIFIGGRKSWLAGVDLAPNTSRPRTFRTSRLGMILLMSILA
jgi:hypothetical protein